MDKLIDLANKLKRAEAELREWESLEGSVRWFDTEHVLTRYVFKNDGGDASRRGVFNFELRDAELKSIMAQRLFDARLKVDELRASFSEEQGKYQKVAV